MIDDDIIKEKIRKYRNGSNTLDDISQYISYFVYSYPKKVFRAEHDRAMDFYIYYIKRFEKMLASYNITDVKFTTWVIRTLRSSYLNFVNTKVERLKYQAENNFPFDENCIIESKYNIYDILVRPDTNQEIDLFRYITKMNKYIEKNYSDLESLVFRLHHLEVFETFVPRSIFKYFNLTYKEVLLFLQDAKGTYFTKRQSFNKMQDRILSLSSKIIDLERKFATIDDIQKLKDRKDKYFFRLQQFKMVVPYSYLSVKFNISTNKVAKIIAKIRKDIRANFVW